MILIHKERLWKKYYTGYIPLQRFHMKCNYKDRGRGCGPLCHRRHCWGGWIDNLHPHALHVSERHLSCLQSEQSACSSTSSINNCSLWAKPKLFSDHSAADVSHLHSETSAAPYSTSVGSHQQTGLMTPIVCILWMKRRLVPLTHLQYLLLASLCELTTGDWSKHAQFVYGTSLLHSRAWKRDNEAEDCSL